MSDENNIDTSAPEKETTDEVDTLSAGTDESDKGDEVVENSEEVQKDESGSDEEEIEKNEPEDDTDDSEAEDIAEEVDDAGEADKENEETQIDDSDGDEEETEKDEPQDDTTDSESEDIAKEADDVSEPDEENEETQIDDSNGDEEETEEDEPQDDTDGSGSEDIAEEAEDASEPDEENEETQINDSDGDEEETEEDEPQDDTDGSGSEDIAEEAEDASEPDEENEKTQVDDSDGDEEETEEDEPQDDTDGSESEDIAEEADDVNEPDEENKETQVDDSDGDEEETEEDEPQDDTDDSESEDNEEETDKNEPEDQAEEEKTPTKNKKQSDTGKKEKIVKILKRTAIISLPLLIAAVLFFLKPAFITNLFNNSELELDASEAASGRWTPEELEMIQTAKEALKETENTWNTIFTEKGGVYRSPKIAFFTDTISSVCKNINNEKEEPEKEIEESFTGTFYCPNEKRIYVDLSLQRDLNNRLDIPENFTQGYVIAHEVGHHIQNLAGISEQLPAARLQLKDKKFAKILERMELQADCFAGIWAKQTAQETYNTGPEEFADALSAVSRYSREHLKENKAIDTMPDTFTYSSLRFRLRWFTIGYDKGSFDACDTFIVTEL